MSIDANAVASDTRGGIHRSLPLSLIATASVAVVPTFFAFAVLVFSRQEPMLLAAVVLSIVLTACAVIAGSAIWARQPESAGVSFGDLMLWSWIRQYRAERTLHEASATLGFNRFGNYVGHSTASGEEQVRAMRAIAKALDAKSTYTLGHSARVAKHARKVARELELPEDRAQTLVLAAELHDVGNIALPDEILRKAGDLTIAERSEIEGHVLVGAVMVEKAGSTEVVAGIKSHHERFDGQGYPDGLSGERIPAFARIIAIAEAYDAMTSTRPYRQSFSKQHAVAVLRAESGTQFDGDLVEVFVATLRKPIPFIGALPFLTAIQAQFRELFLVFKRIGAVAVSATASTIAIALILGGTTLSPGTWDRIAPDFLDRRSDQRGEIINRVLADELAESGDGSAIPAAAAPPSGTVSTSASDNVLGVRFQRAGNDGSVAGAISGDVDVDVAGDRSGGGDSPAGGGSGGEEPEAPETVDPDDGKVEEKSDDDGETEEKPDKDDGKVENPDDDGETEEKPDKDDGKVEEKPDKDDAKTEEEPDKDDDKQ